MIVRPNGDGTLLLITQPDHARLAAAVIAAWDGGPPLPAASRAAVLFAIEQHDNGWREIDQAPTLNLETGRPYDFMTLPAGVKQDIWPRGIERLAADSPLAAALVAEHALSLHAHRREDPAWHAFFSRVESLEARLLRECQAEAGAARDAFDRSYGLLYLGDIVSLVFCNRWPRPTVAGDYRLALEGDDTVLVSPDPFAGNRVCCEVTARAIPDRPYRSDADLRSAFAAANIVRLTAAVRGQ